MNTSNANNDLIMTRLLIWSIWVLLYNSTVQNPFLHINTNCPVKPTLPILPARGHDYNQGKRNHNRFYTSRLKRPLSNVKRLELVDGAIKGGNHSLDPQCLSITSAPDYIH